MSIRIAGARVVLLDDVVETDVVTDSGTIQAIGEALPTDQTIDASGLLLAPALVDIHGDAFERQIMPRPNVFFPLDTAILDTDKQLAANGIATAFHGLTLSWEPGLRSVERGAAFVQALARLSRRLTVENRLQVRWETFAFEAIDVIASALQAEHVPAIAFNDHTSLVMRDRSISVQDRQFQHSPNYAMVSMDDPIIPSSLARQAGRSGLTAEAYFDLFKEVWARRDAVPAKIADVAQMAKDRGAALLSHDDTQVETRDFFRAHGATTSEFPMRAEVAEAARAAGDSIVFGAPNVVRGGSHIGSPAAADMVEAGLCDVLASDYYYPAMLGAVARLVADKRTSLPAAWSQVSHGPAQAMGLTDRGAIQPGLRADLVLVDWPANAAPTVLATMRGGEWIYRAARV